MAPKPSLSITLPRSFTFHYTDGEIPKTPAPAPEVDITEPPPPPRQTFKVRRRRGADNVARDQLSDNDSDTLPTFKMTEADDTSPEIGSAVTPGYLAPGPALLPLLSPPRTPVSQIGSYGIDKDISEWSMINNSQDLIARPLSACSSFSDSSASSCGSSNNSYPSLGGSCASPDSEAADPFSYYDVKMDQPIFSPEMLEDQSPVAKRQKSTRHPKWTSEMDNHLWYTYAVYIGDPRVTPFKMLPGTAPPLGVCHRVAREAKHSWKGHRAASLSMQQDPVIPRISVGAGSPDTIRPTDSAGSSTPIAADSKQPPKWPRSEAATRRRLRELCKRKPSLSAHYQRLLQTRSPSPLQSSSPQSRSDPQSAAFSSRSMNVSLAAATAPSMQADGPLAQLTSDAPPQQTQKEAEAAPAPQRPDGWFARIGRSQAHQKSQSLQLGLGLGYGYGSQVGSSNNQLESPFDGDFDRSTFLNSINATKSLGRNFSGKSDMEPSLNSPLELHAPIPTARSLKRRFKLDADEAPVSHNTLQSLFENATVEASPRPTPARERAFSLGAVGDGTRSLSSFFSRQHGPDLTMTDAADLPTGSGLLQPPEPMRRLGSPFGGASSTAHFNTFPRRFVPLGSENPAQTMEERFRELAGAHQRS